MPQGQENKRRALQPITSSSSVIDEESQLFSPKFFQLIEKTKKDATRHLAEAEERKETLAKLLQKIRSANPSV